MTDMELKNSLLRRDLEPVYQELKQPVYTICLRIIGRRELAEDICHDVFLKLFQCPIPSDLRSVRAWVFQIARNLSIDALRSAENQPMADAGTADAADTPDWILRMDLEAAIASLPPIQREILTLHLNAGFGFAQIARLTGLSLPSVYRRYRSAIKSLQDTLKGDYL